MSVDRDALVRELKSLRLGRGISLPRVLEAETLREVIGRHVLPEPLVRQLRQMIDLIGDEQRRNALLCAYGLHPSYRLPRPEARRQRLAESLGKTDRTVLNWENQAIDELATMLLGEAPDASSDIDTIELYAWVLGFRVARLNISVQAVATNFKRVTELTHDEKPLLLPCVMYEVPVGWQVQKLITRVNFTQNGIGPKRVVSIQGHSITETLMGLKQQNLVTITPADEPVQVINSLVNQPTAGAYYGLYWEF